MLRDRQPRTQVPSVRLSVYGAGHLREQLEQLKIELGIDTQIQLMGEKADIHSRICTAKAFVMSSDYEGLPNALMEAMSIGLPCISTDCSPGGARMLIKNRENGIIVPCDDADALAAALKEVLTDRNLARTIGNNAVSLRNKVDSRSIAHAWLSLLGELVEPATRDFHIE